MNLLNHLFDRKEKLKEKEFLKFPDGFIWGAATAAHQVEGGTNNDWTQWESEQAKILSESFEKYYKDQVERNLRFKFDPERFALFKNEFSLAENFISGRAAEHYTRYPQDFDLMKSLNFNGYRFSIEWSRIQPTEEGFDQEAIEYYRKYIKELKSRGIEPFLTLWHWTMPIWLADKGGTGSKNFTFYFKRFVQRVVDEYHEDVKFWITINEPLVHATSNHFAGVGPHGQYNFISMLRSIKVLINSHNEAYRIIKEIDKDSKVSVSHQIIPAIAYKDKFINKIAKFLIDSFNNYYFIDKTKNCLDFLGLNNYILFEINRFKRVSKSNRISDLNWELTPESVYLMLKDCKKYNLPVYITENGLADRDDIDRQWYIKEVVKYMYLAIEDGVDLRGYLHWSLLDNFEWDKGFWPRFGIIHVDYKTMKRTIRESGRLLGTIAKDNGLKLEAEV